jgi:nucleotide-binding universal stress UspA family protein
MKTVVVGIDGSAASKDALRWAANYAGLIGGQLRAVAVWEWPLSSGMRLPFPDGFDPTDDARSVLQATLREVLGETPPVPVTTSVMEGSAPFALLSESKAADLLVVGSRGHSGLTGMLLGSTSESCAAPRHLPGRDRPSRKRPETGREKP